MVEGKLRQRARHNVMCAKERSGDEGNAKKKGTLRAHCDQVLKMIPVKLKLEKKIKTSRSVSFSGKLLKSRFNLSYTMENGLERFFARHWWGEGGLSRS